MQIEHKPQCLAAHLGEYLMEPSQFSQLFSAVRANGFQPLANHDTDILMAGAIVGTDYGGSYVRNSDGIAAVHLSGMLMKGQSKYGGTSTIGARAALRAAVDDKDVKGIMLVIDSPGGHVAGTQALADEVVAAKTQKPVVAHIEDLGASAAYWAASGADRITVNRTGFVGSIGVINVIQDTSGAAQAEGIKTHVLTTGKYKGVGVDGVEVSDDHLAYMQERVDGLFAHFAAAVQHGRGMDEEAFAGVSDGRVFSAATAMELGLVDAIESMDQASEYLAKQIEAQSANQRRRMRTAQAKLDLI